MDYVLMFFFLENSHDGTFCSINSCLGHSFPQTHHVFRKIVKSSCTKYIFSKRWVKTLCFLCQGSRQDALRLDAGAQKRPKQREREKFHCHWHGICHFLQTLFVQDSSTCFVFCMFDHSTALLYYISLTCGQGKQNNQCTDPMNNDKDCRVGQFTSLIVDSSCCFSCMFVIKYFAA